MAGDHEKVKSISCFITKELHNAFIKKIVSEGWNIQQALSRLILEYVNEGDNDNI
jgi:hypothetical protein